MNLPAPAEADIQRIVSLVVAEVHPLRVVLFGSASRGEQGENSDVDLMVVVPEGTDTLRAEQRLHLNIGKDRSIMFPVDFAVTTPSEYERYKDSIGYVYRVVANTGKEMYAA